MATGIFGYPVLHLLLYRNSLWPWSLVLAGRVMYSSDPWLESLTFPRSFFEILGLSDLRFKKKKNMVPVGTEWGEFERGIPTVRYIKGELLHSYLTQDPKFAKQNEPTETNNYNMRSVVERPCSCTGHGATARVPSTIGTGLYKKLRYEGEMK